MRPGRPAQPGDGARVGWLASARGEAPANPLRGMQSVTKELRKQALPNQGTLNHGRTGPGCAPRGARARTTPQLQPGGARHPCSRHRREHRPVQRRLRPAAAAVAVSGRRRDRAGGVPERRAARDRMAHQQLPAAVPARKRTPSSTLRASRRAASSGTVRTAPSPCAERWSRPPSSRSCGRPPVLAGSLRRRMHAKEPWRPCDERRSSGARSRRRTIRSAGAPRPGARDADTAGADRIHEEDARRATAPGCEFFRFGSTTPTGRK